MKRIKRRASFSPQASRPPAASPRARGPTRAVGPGIVIAFALGVLIYGGNDALVALQGDTPSVSHGTTASGSLEHGKRLPTSGENFVSYSRLGALLGRTTVHHRVRDLLVESYGALLLSHSGLRFKIGETGWPRGGRFRPHRTHQNGLSVDFMVPVRREGVVTTLPTWPWQKFGYGIDFNSDGRSGTLVIDYDAINAHLLSLKALAPKHGLKIERVIFAPDLQPDLKATAKGALDGLPFNTGQAWVRHDEHYHVDFVVTGG